MGLKGQNSTFSKHGHVAYQIERNQKCSTMVAYILPADPLDPAGGVNKSQLSFSKHVHVTYQTKGNQGQKSTFSEHSYVAYQIKGNHECSNMVANILPAGLSPSALGFKRSTFNFSEHGHVAYQIKGNNECSNIVANILPAPNHGGEVNRSTIIFFRTWSCCISN